MNSMRKSRAITLLASIALLAVTAHAAPPKYDAVYVFGDSLCDVGNLSLSTDGLVPASPPYYKGRFSNGPIWVEHFAGALGLTLKASLAGGTDFAVGGAMVTAPVETILGTIPDVGQQVSGYLAKHGGKADPRALYLVEGGGNDILDTTGTSEAAAKALGAEIATDLSDSVTLLRRAGATHFLVPNLLNVGRTPAAAAFRKFASEAAVAANNSLRELLGAEPDVVLLNQYTELEALFTDPSHFGFSNVTTQCLNTTTNKVCADSDHTLFWDDVHPSEFGHSLLAVNALAALVQ